MAVSNRLTRRFVGAILAGALALWLSGPSRLSPATPPTAAVIALDGAIDPASAAYVVHSLSLAQRLRASVIVLRLDTPGGLETAMRDIIRAILASPVPVIGYVAPSGARAASAGTYILYASALAAMDPVPTSALLLRSRCLAGRHRQALKENRPPATGGAASRQPVGLRQTQ